MLSQVAIGTLHETLEKDIKTKYYNNTMGNTQFIYMLLYIQQRAQYQKARRMRKTFFSEYLASSNVFIYKCDMMMR